MRLLSEKAEGVAFSKKELDIIIGIVGVFSQQIDWQYEIVDNKNVFKKEFENRFLFQLIELSYVTNELWGMSGSLDDIDIKELYISFFQEQIPYKPLVIYTALNECSKNFEDYEVSIISGYYQEELDKILKEYKEKVIDVIYKYPIEKNLGY